MEATNWDIQKKEEEYRKENERIESKTKEILKRVDYVMKIQDKFVKGTSNPKRIEKEPIKLPEVNSFKAFVDEFLDLDSRSSCNAQLLDENSDTNRNVHHFYKIKIKSLQNDISKLQGSLKSKTSEIKQLQENVSEANEAKEKWFKQYNVGKTNINKLGKQIDEFNSKMQSKENENYVLKKEIEGLKKEIKVLTASLTSTEVKLNKLLDENERNKTSVANLRREDRETKENYKKQINELNANVQLLEKQKTELIQGFKKQLQLIDVLKKQKAHLETFNLSQIAESEFMKLLDCHVDQ